MASVLLVKSGDQTELLSGRGRSTLAEADEAASSFLTLEEGDAPVREEAPRARKTGKIGSGCACRLSGAQMNALFLALLGLLAAAFLTLELHRSRTLRGVRAELDAMHHQLEALHHRVYEEDLFNDLRAFEEAVYAEEAASERDDDDDDDVDDDDDDTDDDLAEDANDVDYYSEEDESNPVDATAKPESGTHDRLREYYANMVPVLRVTHPYNKPKKELAGAVAAAAAEAEVEAKKLENRSAGARTKREIPARPPDVGTVPVIVESYGVPAAPAHNNSEGLRLYESLVAAGGQGDPPMKKSHRLMWRGKKQHRDTAAVAQRERTWPSSSSPAQPGAPQYLRHRTEPLLLEPSPQPAVITRASRVMETGTVAPPSPRRLPPSRLQFLTAPKTAGVSSPPEDPPVMRVYQNTNDNPGAAWPNDIGRRNRNKKKLPMKKILDNLKSGDELTTGSNSRGNSSPHNMRRRPILAAHYEGNTSKYYSGHEHYKGNGHLRHPSGLFSDWYPSTWMRQLNMDKKFTIDNGVLKVTDSGLYFVYAQIFYLDQHDTNGYRVEVNNKPVLQCTITSGQTSVGTHDYKRNTCFTAGAMYLAANDNVTVKEVGSMRWTVFEPEKSFFGMLKLGPTLRM